MPAAVVCMKKTASSPFRMPRAWIPRPLTRILREFETENVGLYPVIYQKSCRKMIYILEAILTPNGLFLTGTPPKNILTECRPIMFDTYSHFHRLWLILRIFTGTVVLWPAGSKIITSGIPLSVSVESMQQILSSNIPPIKFP